MAKGIRMCLVDMDAAIDAAGTVQTLRYGDQPYTTEPGDTPANAYYEPRVSALGSVVREMFDGERTAGRSRVGFGEIKLLNTDGELDALRGYSFGNRPLVIRVGYQADAYAALAQSLVATASGVELTTRTVTVTLKDRQSELDKPLQATLYAGTNALPAGVEGVDDLEGKPKPRTFGTVYNVAPPCVNTSRLIYQVNDGAIASLSVYDGGVVLTAGAAYASQADMEASAPSAGQVRVWAAGGMFRLGSSPTYQITADVVEESDANSTCAQILKRIALAAGIDAGDISAADVTALDVDSSAVCGVYFDREISAIAAMDEVAPGAGAYFGFDSTGTLRMGRFEAPAGTPAFELTQDNVGELEREPTDDSLPAWRVVVGYRKNYTVQSSGLAGSVTAARRTVLAEEEQSTPASDASVKTQWLDARTLTRSTPLKLQAAAAAEATRLLNLYKVPRNKFRARRVQLTPEMLAALDIGTVVTLKWPRFDLDAGELYVVIASDIDYVRSRADLTLWGGGT